jgi:hypothetical protein
MKNRISKGNTSIDMLPSFALICLMNYLDYYDEDRDGFADEQVFQLFKKYKNHRDAVKSAFMESFKYLLEESPWRDRRKRSSVEHAKKQLNLLAKKIWK